MLLDLHAASAIGEATLRAGIISFLLVPGTQQIPRQFPGTDKVPCHMHPGSPIPLPSIVSQPAPLLNTAPFFSPALYPGPNSKAAQLSPSLASLPAPAADITLTHGLSLTRSATSWSSTGPSLPKSNPWTLLHPPGSLSSSSSLDSSSEHPLAPRSIVQSILFFFTPHLIPCIPSFSTPGSHGEVPHLPAKADTWRYICKSYPSGLPPCPCSELSLWSQSLPGSWRSLSSSPPQILT